MSSTPIELWTSNGPPKDGRAIVIVGNEAADGVTVVNAVYWSAEHNAWRDFFSGEVLDTLEVGYWVPYPGDTTDIPPGPDGGRVRFFRFTEIECTVIREGLRTLMLTNAGYNEEIKKLAPMFRMEVAR